MVEIRHFESSDDLAAAADGEAFRDAAELEQRWAPPATIPMPDFWGGYLIVPDRIEFWQSRQNRLHDRLSYRRSGGAWTIERLSP